MINGEMQFDLWKVQPTPDRYDWDTLKKQVIEHGIRNSLLLAPMPTASTSQILGNNECFEPYTSNFYTRRTLSGEYMVINKHLLDDLIKLGLWNKEMKEMLMAHNGSIQNISGIPAELKELYKTSWEFSQKALIDLSADRGAFICQSQSLNLFMENATYGKLSSMHFYSWQSGLKTGMYYLRTKAAVDPIKFTLGEKHQRKYVEHAGNEEPVEVISTTTATVTTLQTTVSAQASEMLDASTSLDMPEGSICTMEDGCIMCGS